MSFNDNDFFTEEIEEETQITNEPTFSDDINNLEENNSINYEEEGFKGYVRKYRRSKWFVPTIIILILLIIFVIIFSIWTRSIGTLEEIELKKVSKIYLGETTKIKATAKGKGNLSRTIFHYEITPNNIAFLETLGGVTGKNTTNEIHPIITGKAELSIYADLEGSTTKSKKQEIIICKRLDKKFEDTKIELLIGNNKKIPIDVGTENLCYESLEYKIKDTSIAIIESNKIIGKKVGNTQIIIRDNKDEITIPIIVSEDIKPIEKITLNKKEKTLTVGETFTVTTKVEPSDTKENIYWKSSNEAVATVTNGKITAISKGTATIKATNNDNSISASLKVNVLDKTTEAPKPNNTITYSVTMKSDGLSTRYAKKDDTITVAMSFSKSLSSIPKVIIGGSNATVTGNGKNYQATLKVGNSQKEGKVSLKITFKDNNNTRTITRVTQGNTVIIDKTNPQCSLTYQNNILTIRGNDTNGISGYLINPNSTSTGKYTSTKQYIPTANGTYYGHVLDKAGNFGLCKYQITSIGDITSPKIKSVTMKSSNQDPKIAKVGDTITVTMEFSEELGIAPSVGIADHSAIISKINSTTYRAIVKIDSSYKDGLVYLSISNYKDLAGNVGIGRTTVTDDSVVTIKK